MPELPEVETVRASLARDLVGRRIRAVAVSNGRAVRRHASAREFRGRVEGRVIRSVERLGKYLVMALDNGDHLVVHLGMSGRLLRAKGPKEPRAKHTHVVFTLSPAGELRYVDPRTFGELFVSSPPGEDVEVAVAPVSRLVMGGDGMSLRRRVPELAHLGIDPLADQVAWDRFGAIVRSRSGALKAVLTDQDIVAGLGNIYADEILFTAGLRFDRPAASLTTIETRRLFRAVIEILADAVKAGGSTLDDEQFVDPDGHPGTYQESHQVYGREGQPCPQCRRPVERAVFHGRATFWCPACQA